MLESVFASSKTTSGWASKISYRVRRLKEARLIREKKRGRWSFYSLDQEAVEELLHETVGHIGGEVS
jgi:DNA-binding transcriptional ArsR family regulator